MSPIKWGRTPEFIDLSDLFGNMDKPFFGYFLFYQPLWENRRKSFRSNRIPCPRMQSGKTWIMHIRLDVVPLFGDIFFGEQYLCRIGHFNPLHKIFIVVILYYTK